ncbi:LexA family protein [Liquorilactobacillus satsumensis]|uniref:Xre family DNA-binding protein n=1 Tax=Liquorilactobacillus satsumensis DSM 16230 = JCM 12392 TaxID=1423801 RepID=A0A0R1UWZ2_9LACO|nr:XRE family transcriptional regulator [Liquorilactobacillus satsumensis]KRL97776.1 Xre family DNA-binding protein [Liquorilactobacillus satsumensis DSM 16230 = JCM 12392]MCC7666162.1 XRE family transcriptional regulator [Liquorilactobacillus satsumensis]MCP9313381.1 helix-turn-helix domain-containing protein [Liquorilactobacillus satsumensis]MCP9329156.1 helix-turn-helix domain-containing protein [Liquorilactobacillus satsumensis]MCP9357429.1 helix-turn-helix domain-containing protein [Liquo
MKSNAAIVKQMRELAQQQNISISELARRVAMAKSAVSKYFNETRAFPLNRLESFAKALGTTSEHLLGVEVPANMTPVYGVVKIPVIGVIACGDPITAEENIEGYVEEPKETLPAGQLFYLRAKGDSMSPTIPDGSNVLIRQQPEVEDGEIAAVLLTNENEATLKRIKHTGKLILLLPDNPKYDPLVSSPENPIKILGKAIRFVSEL